MTCVTLAILDEVDDRLKKRMRESQVLLDHLIDKAGGKFLLATTEEYVPFEGVEPVQVDAVGRGHEDFLALISEKRLDFSFFTYRIYADPFNTESLIDDQRIGDGFIFKTETTYKTPEESYWLLRAIKSGEKVTSVYRRGGEQSSAVSDRVFLARCGPYHPKTEELIKPFKVKSRKSTKIHTLYFTVKDGKITVDNTFKPKTLKMPIL